MDKGGCTQDGVLADQETIAGERCQNDASRFRGGSYALRAAQSAYHQLNERVTRGLRTSLDGS